MTSLTTYLYIIFTAVFAFAKRSLGGAKWLNRKKLPDAADRALVESAKKVQAKLAWRGHGSYLATVLNMAENSANANVLRILKRWA